MFLFDLLFRLLVRLLNVTVALLRLVLLLLIVLLLSLLLCSTVMFLFLFAFCFVRLLLVDLPVVRLLVFVLSGPYHLFRSSCVFRVASVIFKFSFCFPSLLRVHVLCLLPCSTVCLFVFPCFGTHATWLRIDNDTSPVLERL